jgi:hypothetical protein
MPKGDTTKTDSRAADICDECGWTNRVPGYDFLRAMFQPDTALEDYILCVKCYNKKLEAG